MAKPPPPARLKKPVAPKADRDLAKLPAALQSRAEAAAAVAHDRLTRAARAAFDEARAAMEQAARGYYALGRALTALKTPGYAEALGYAGGFRALCDEGLGLSKTSVARLTTAVEQLTAGQYAALRPARVDALLDLAAATPADDTRAILDGAVIALWDDGPTLDVAAASTALLHASAVQVRDHLAAASGRRKRGRTVSTEERALTQESAERLRAAGSRATAKARATAAGRPSVFDLVGLDEAELRAAVSALHKRAAAKKR